MAQPGDKIRNFVTAAWFNRVDAYTKQKRPPPPPNKPMSGDRLVIRLKNTSGSNYPIWHPVILSPTILNEAETLRDPTKVIMPASLAQDFYPVAGWVVTAEPIANGQIGDAVLHGLVNINCGPLAPGNYRCIGFNPEIPGIGPAAQGAIWHTYMQDGGNYIYLCTKQTEYQSTLYRFELKADLNETSCAAKIYTLDGTLLTEEGTVYDEEEIFQELEEGHRGLCVWSRGYYHIVNAKCPEDQITSE